MKKLAIILLAVVALLGCSAPQPVLVFKAPEPAPSSPPSHRVGSFTPTPTGTGLAKVSGGTFVAAAATLVDADVNAAAGLTWSKFGTGSQNYGAQEFDSTVDAKGTLKDRQPVHVQTTDATVTVVDSWTIASNSAQGISGLCTSLRSDNAAAGAWTFTAAFKNNGGTVSQLGTTSVTVIGALDDAAWGGPTVDNSTTTIRVKFTGKAATTIQTTCSTTRLEVVP